MLNSYKVVCARKGCIAFAVYTPQLMAQNRAKVVSN